MDNLIIRIMFLILFISCSDGQEEIIVRDVAITNNNSSDTNSSENDNSNTSSSTTNNNSTDTNSSESGNSNTSSSTSNNSNQETNNSESIELEGDLIRGEIFQNKIFIVSENKIYKSDDLGLNWSVLITVEDNINDIEIVNEEIFFFSTEDSSIYKTTNGGFTFESERIEEFWSRNSSINGLEINNNYLYAIRTRESYSTLLYSSNNNDNSYYTDSYYYGFTTELLKFDMDLNSIAIRHSAALSSFNLLSYENQILISDRDRVYIYDADDLERTSRFDYKTGEINEFIVKIINTGDFLLAIGKGIWVSTNNGINFTKKSFLNTDDIYSATVDNEGNIYVVGKNGLLAHSGPDLTTWSVIETNTNENLYFVGLIEDKLIVSGSNSYFNRINLN